MPALYRNQTSPQAKKADATTAEPSVVAKKAAPDSAAPAAERKKAAPDAAAPPAELPPTKASGTHKSGHQAKMGSEAAPAAGAHPRPTHAHTPANGTTTTTLLLPPPPPSSPAPAPPPAQALPAGLTLAQKAALAGAFGTEGCVCRCITSYTVLAAC